jgi:hypothetical protein
MNGYVVQMWEWRIFTTRESIKIPMAEITRQLEKVSMEERTDYYYNLKDKRYGLKERGTTSIGLFDPKLELKLLISEENKLECWEKVIKKTVHQKISNKQGLAIKQINEILAKETVIVNKKYKKMVQEVNELFNKHQKDRVPVAKKRKQIIVYFDIKTKELSFAENLQKYEDTEILWLEKTAFKIKNEKGLTLAIECHNKKVLQEFIDDHLNFKNGRVMGYPEYINTLV